jgi:hypothetical protein
MGMDEENRRMKKLAALCLVALLGCSTAQVKVLEQDASTAVNDLEAAEDWVAGNAPAIQADVQAVASAFPNNKTVQQLAADATTALSANDLATAHKVILAAKAALAKVAPAPAPTPVAPAPAPAPSPTP